MDARDLLADFIFTGKYARHLPALNRRETFEESVDRMRDMHLRRYIKRSQKSTNIADNILMADDIFWAFDMVKEGRLLASQRALQFGGAGVEHHNMRIYNCATSYCDRVRFFAETFYMLLCGCGTGFSVQRRHVDKLPKLAEKYNKGSVIKWVIPDTIEGWADSLDLLISSHLQTKDMLEINTIEFDYSAIRPKGAALSTGGKAPGPEPLRIALERIREVLHTAIDRGQERLRPIDCYDIAMHASDAVLSGGVRRAASIALFDADDEEMMTSKTGNWRNENPQRARANNSAVLIKNEDNRSLFDTLMRSTKEFGEPGFIFVAHPDYIYNPCAEIGMCPQLILNSMGDTVQEYTLEILNNRDKYESQGYEYMSGWQTCNLVTINASMIKCIEDFEIAIRAAAIIGTLQSGYTDTGYLGNISKEIIEREALLGISMTGMMESPDIVLNPEIQLRMAQLAVSINQEMANRLGIPSAARVTCVKPEGTGTLVLKATNGIHADHSRRYIKRVQNNKLDPVFQFFKQRNPHMCERSIWNTNTEDELVAFPIEARPETLLKSDFTAKEFLKVVLDTQKNWVIGGTARPMSCEGLTHNVSNTCEVQDNEWMGVADFIYENKQWFSGISLMSNYGDYIYEQAPFQRVYSKEDLIAKFGVDAFNLAISIYAEGGSTALTKMYGPEDCSETTKFILDALMLEDYWVQLKMDMAPVDYTQLIEVDDSTKVMDTIACGGAGCTI